MAEKLDSKGQNGQKGQNEQQAKRPAKRNVKDTVFSKLFEDYDNLLLLYKALYPEDTDITKDDLREVLLEHVLFNGLYNDLSFTVRNKFIVLLEAQSTWTSNILPRALTYYANFLNEHIKRTEQNVYGTKKVEIPRPDIYVVYTGRHKVEKKVLSLREEFWNGEEAAVELTARVIYLEEARDLNILEQYIRYAQVYDACMEEDKRNGKVKPDVDTVKKAIDICLNEGVLTNFLTERRKEIVDIMMMLFDQDYLDELAKREAYKEGEARGEARGRAEGRAEGEASAMRRFLEMLNSGKSKEEILATCSV